MGDVRDRGIVHYINNKFLFLGKIPNEEYLTAEQELDHSKIIGSVAQYERPKIDGENGDALARMTLRGVQKNYEVINGCIDGIIEGSQSPRNFVYRWFPEPKHIGTDILGEKIVAGKVYLIEGALAPLERKVVEKSGLAVKV